MAWVCLCWLFTWSAPGGWFTPGSWLCSRGLGTHGLSGPCITEGEGPPPGPRYSGPSGRPGESCVAEVG